MWGNQQNRASESENGTGEKSLLRFETPAGSALTALECCICMGDIREKMTLEKCGHCFCRECICRAFEDKSVCPVCGTVYGTLLGNMPINGTMKVLKHPNVHLQGYETYGTLLITYNFPDGIQGKEHPSPGMPYSGTYREAFLPDSPEGKRVVGLLRKAFNQRLTFTIGTSMTTGRSNVITWNDIHHKTSICGGPECFGYPDPTYLTRVQEELKAKGISVEDNADKC